MNDCMTFPSTVEEFMERYKIVDTEKVYTNGAEMIPIFRMKQWFEHLPTVEGRKTGKWEISVDFYGGEDCKCPVCEQRECAPYWNFCPNCGADMRGDEE